MTTQTTPRLPFEIWALIAGSFAVAVGYGVVAPVLPQLASSFGVSITAASAIVSAFAAMRLVFAPAAGWFVNKWGERPTYTIGLLIVAASTGACAIAATYGQLLVLRAAGGIGSTMFSIAATGLLIRLAPVKMRGRISSYNAASFLLGGLLGPGARRRRRKLRAAGAVRLLLRHAPCRSRTRRPRSAAQHDAAVQTRPR
ncbi:MFS transporter [Agrococcus casei]|uniref:MFS transporter n=1 Tax=Agrococcus casei TaxID=343512 RepID=UPI003F90C0FC